MNQGLKEQIVKKTINIANNTTDSTFKRDRHPWKLLQAHGFYFYLVGDVYDQYAQLCDQLLQNSDWSKKFSRKYIDGHVHQVLNRVVESIMPLENQTKRDWLVRCKMEHAEKETEAVYSRL